MKDLDVLEQILHRLTLMEERLDLIESQTGRMGDHISFVEGVYTTLRRPLNFVVELVNKTMSIQQGPQDASQETTLPSLDH